NPGQGSTFAFTVTLKVAARGTEPAETVKPELAGLRVLVVDDSASNRAILEDALKTWGLQARGAGSVSEALRQLREAARQERSYQLLLADGHMPGMDGFELFQEIRRSPELDVPAVMMLTSDDYYASVRRCGQMGIAAHVIKPVRLCELLAAVRQALAPATHEAQRPHQGERQPGRPLRILLAEDNLVNQRLAIRLLEKMGHQVVVVQTGEEALLALSADKFDLVLMDVQMPEMDGFAATREIRRREQGGKERLPVIAMTAHAMKGDRESCMEAGMDDYLAKPIHREELQQAIARTMKPRKEEVSAQSPGFD
ncbi:MAG: response regulator, partial [Terriglobales bacterium]